MAGWNPYYRGARAGGVPRKRVERGNYGFRAGGKTPSPSLDFVAGLRRGGVTKHGRPAPPSKMRGAVFGGTMGGGSRTRPGISFSGQKRGGVTKKRRSKKSKKCTCKHR